MRKNFLLTFFLMSLMALEGHAQIIDDGTVEIRVGDRVQDVYTNCDEGTVVHIRSLLPGTGWITGYIYIVRFDRSDCGARSMQREWIRRVE